MGYEDYWKGRAEIAETQRGIADAIERIEARVTPEGAERATAALTAAVDADYRKQANETWRGRALRLVALIDRMEPNDEFCWACGQYKDHEEDCVSGELNAAIDEIRAAGRDRFDPAG